MTPLQLDDERRTKYVGLLRERYGPDAARRLHEGAPTPDSDYGPEPYGWCLWAWGATMCPVMTCAEGRKGTFTFAGQVQGEMCREHGRKRAQQFGGRWDLIKRHG